LGKNVGAAGRRIGRRGRLLAAKERKDRKGIREFTPKNTQGTKKERGSKLGWVEESGAVVRHSFFHSGVGKGLSGIGLLETFFDFPQKKDTFHRILDGGVVWEIAYGAKHFVLNSHEERVRFRREDSRSFTTATLEEGRDAAEGEG